MEVGAGTPQEERRTRRGPHGAATDKTIVSLQNEETGAGDVGCTGTLATTTLSRTDTTGLLCCFPLWEKHKGKPRGLLSLDLLVCKTSKFLSDSAVVTQTDPPHLRHTGLALCNTASKRLMGSQGLSSEWALSPSPSDTRGLTLSSCISLFIPNVLPGKL